MPETSTLRRLMTLPVLIIGALTTIATSPVQPTEMASERTLDLAPGEAVYLEVVVNEVAMDHIRALDMRDVAGGLEVEVDALDVRVVPDDVAFPPLESGGRFTVGLSACPETGGCALGYTIESTGEAGSTVRVIGRAWVQTHAQFLFPENRDFPAEAEIRIVVDGE